MEESVPLSSVSEFLTYIGNADALLFSTPEYAGGTPGALKNLLEWTIGSTVMASKPVGWFNPSTAPQRAAGAFVSLETMLQYTGVSIIRDACRDIPVTRSQISNIGTVDDAPTRELISSTVRVLISSVEAE